VIDQPRAGPDEDFPSTDDREVVVRYFTAMFDSVKERRVEPSQPSQRLGIQAIALAIPVVDHPHVTGVRYDDLVAQRLDKAAHPG
jgi:hypothetical protein